MVIIFLYVLIMLQTLFVIVFDGTEIDNWKIHTFPLVNGLNQFIPMNY
jgi:hypothetical protein